MRQRKPEQQKLLKNFQKTLTEFQKVQRLLAERKREYVDKAKTHNVQNYAYEDDEVVIYETQFLINDNQRRLQFQVLDNEIKYNKSLIAEREGEIREINKDLTAM
ncbi:t-SNARE [Gigaspora margarita]|uniref:t-SNARE n=1 Tax=Gigaspora margarita TaxID=4874 RepID=A0A8H3XEM8_GIGMA|nr:t-SNARE [Gigaspora margarita]